MQAEIEKSREEIFKGFVFDVYKLQVEQQDGILYPRELVEHNGGACVIALNEKNEIYLVKQFRTGAKEFLLELPAGKLEVNEDPVLCAYRELEEEVGLKANSMELLSEAYPTPGYSSEIIYIYYTNDFSKTEQDLDEGEFLEVFTYPLEEAVDMVFSGEIRDAKTAIAIMMLDSKLKKAK